MNVILREFEKIMHLLLLIGILINPLDFMSIPYFKHLSLFTRFSTCSLSRKGGGGKVTGVSPGEVNSALSLSIGKSLK